VYICNDYARDFYGEELKLVICGYLRPQAKIPWDDLIAAITEDVSVAQKALDDPDFSSFKEDSLFTSWS
jgi:riboflavin kinase